MCDVMSWIEHRGTIKFLTGETITSDKFLKWAEEHKISRGDFYGHGTTRAWYRIDADDGGNEECTDFSTPSNFPGKIVEAIKSGLMRGVPFNIKGVRQLLSQPALADYEKIEQAALADYEKIRQAALADYEKIEQAAWADYGKIRQPAWADYEKIRQAAFWDLFLANEKNRNPKWR